MERVLLLDELDRVDNQVAVRAVVEIPRLRSPEVARAQHGEPARAGNLPRSHRFHPLRRSTSCSWLLGSSACPTAPPLPELPFSGVSAIWRGCQFAK
jgi:hypothetical protein